MVPLTIAAATMTLASTCPFVPTIKVPASDETLADHMAVNAEHRVKLRLAGQRRAVADKAAQPASLISRPSHRSRILPTRDRRPVSHLHNGILTRRCLFLIVASERFFASVLFPF